MLTKASGSQKDQGPHCEITLGTPPTGSFPQSNQTMVLHLAAMMTQALPQYQHP